MWYALKLKDTDMWLGLYGRPKSLLSEGVIQFPTLAAAEEFVLCSENEWTIHGPFPSYNECRKHELWHDFYSDYWSPQIETTSEDIIYDYFLEWLGENET